ncbi:MAG TPA: hypothetical protein VFQ61_35950 [Polyangiaceae bacterium]|nr:hypothetical protein [Polyangiaceae bacterium]
MAAQALVFEGAGAVVAEADGAPAREGTFDPAALVAGSLPFGGAGVADASLLVGFAGRLGSGAGRHPATPTCQTVTSQTTFERPRGGANWVSKEERIAPKTLDATWEVNGPGVWFVESWSSGSTNGRLAQNRNAWRK